MNTYDYKIGEVKTINAEKAKMLLSGTHRKVRGFVGDLKEKIYAAIIEEKDYVTIPISSQSEGTPINAKHIYSTTVRLNKWLFTEHKNYRVKFIFSQSLFLLTKTNTLTEPKTKEEGPKTERVA